MNIEQMKFAYLKEKGCALTGVRKIPDMGPDDVLVKQLVCNICTTDYGQWLGLREHQGYPMAGGHEGSGVVEAVGSDVKDLKPGDHVAVAYNSCGKCEACRRGHEGQCTSADYKNLTEDGYRGNFGFADYNVRSARNLVKMNPELPPSEAAFLEPLATVCKGISKLRLEPQETVVVIGAGTMGLVNAQAAKAKNCRVIVTELMEKKLQAARDMGFEVIDVSKEDPVEKVQELTDQKGADAVIVAVGNTKANTQAAELVKELDGRILMFAAGYPAPEIELDSNVIHYRRMELIGTFGADMKDFFKAAELLNTGAVDVSKLVEPEKFLLDDIQKAYEHASVPGMYRVSVLLNEE